LPQNNTMKEFSLQGSEYIELNKLLKIFHLVGSGGEANTVIDQGMVKVKGEVETRRRNKLRVGDIIEFAGTLIAITE
jgi:ribosome-associated protein